MKQKKGIQLNQAFGTILTLVLVAVLVIVAIVIFVNLATSFEGSVDLSETNDTVDMSSGANYIDNATLCGFDNFAITQVSNVTGDALIAEGNWTTTADGLITNTSSEFPSEWLVTWTGTWGSAACSSSEDMTDEFGNYTSLIGLVGTIIFLGLVIGVLVASFAFGGRKEI